MPNFYDPNLQLGDVIVSINHVNKRLEKLEELAQDILRAVKREQNESLVPETEPYKWRAYPGLEPNERYHDLMLLRNGVRHIAGRLVVRPNEIFWVWDEVGDLSVDDFAEICKKIEELKHES